MGYLLGVPLHCWGGCRRNLTRSGKKKTSFHTGLGPGGITRVQSCVEQSHEPLAVASPPPSWPHGPAPTVLPAKPARTAAATKLLLPPIEGRHGRAGSAAPGWREVGNGGCPRSKPPQINPKPTKPLPKPIQNPPKTHSKFTQNLPKTNPNRLQNQPKTQPKSTQNQPKPPAKPT